MNETGISVWERYNYSDLLLFETFAPHLTIVERTNFPLWAIPGIPGSLFSVLVWSSRTMRRGGTAAAAVYQASLGIVDFCFFLIHVNWYLHVAWQLGVLDHPVVCEVFPVLNYFIQYMSPTLTLAFSFERYLAICHPFHSQRFMMRSSSKSAIKFVGIICVFCFLTASVQALVYTYDNGVCTTRAVIEDTSRVESTLYTNWTFITEALFFFCLPITCLVLNILVIKVLRKSVQTKKNPLMSTCSNGPDDCTERNNKNKSHLNKGARASTLTLLCTSFYLICAHLSVATAVLIYKILPTGDVYLSDEEIRQDSGWTIYFRFFTVRVLIDCFAMTHYAAKFPIYLATSKQFRQEFCKLFCHKSASKDPFNVNPFDSPTNGLQMPRNSIFKYRSSCVSNVTNISCNMKQSLRRPRTSTRLTVPNMINDQADFSPRSAIKRRPSPGLSRTVIAPNGERVRICNNNQSET